MTKEEGLASAGAAENAIGVGAPPPDSLPAESPSDSTSIVVLLSKDESTSRLNATTIARTGAEITPLLPGDVVVTVKVRDSAAFALASVAAAAFIAPLAIHC